jgi:hypothetical protein
MVKICLVVETWTQNERLYFDDWYSDSLAALFYKIKTNSIFNLCKCYCLYSVVSLMITYYTSSILFKVVNHIITF